MTAWQDLAVEQNNDTTFTIALTYGGAPFNPTGYTLTVYLKAAETSPDSGATTFTVGSGLTIINAQLGQVSWKVPHTDAATAGSQWWRIDAVDGTGNRTTLIMGNFTVQAD